MAGPKAKTPAPIDRPLSKAYLRQFSGWSTNQAPGVSDPTSLRIMENVQINRDGTCRIRPGLRYLSYATPPSDTAPGAWVGYTLIGTYEPFYLNDGSKAYLQAVTETNGSVGWRVLTTNTNGSAVYKLTDDVVNFDVPQGEDVLNFTSATTYVTYLQIDNKIVALSNAGERMRLFKVGAKKEAKALFSIERPEWDNDDKLTVVHPDAAWILGTNVLGRRKNMMRNPSFEYSHQFWTAGVNTDIHRPKTPPVTPTSGTRVLTLKSRPERTNLAAAPLHDVATTGLSGWGPWTLDGHGEVANIQDPATSISVNGTYMQIDGTNPGDHAAFYARSHMWEGVKAGEHYVVAYDSISGSNMQPRFRVKFFGVDGAQVGTTVVRDVATGTGRRVSDRVKAPKGAVSMRLFIGGVNTGSTPTSTRAKNVVVCPEGEATTMFTGSSGTDYLWTGTVNNSSSVYHPAKDVSVRSEKCHVTPNKALSVSAYIGAATTARSAKITVYRYDKVGKLLGSETSTVANDTVGVGARYSVNYNPVSATTIRVEVEAKILGVPRGEVHTLDAVLVERKVSTAGTYFDGDTVDSGTVKRDWRNDQGESISIETTYDTATANPAKETRTQETLIATGGPYVNIYGFGFFYTFDNEIGTSAPSKVTELRCQRPWSDWLWEKPDATTGNPSGTDTDNPEMACDQLVATMPQEVYDEAVASGATEWSLYMVTWSEQDAAPVMALKVATRKLPSTATYGTHGWLRVTPETTGAVDELPLPRKSTIRNYSDPPRAGNGATVRDRLVLVNDPTDAAVIRWTSNEQGDYLNFTPSKGGGYKTLTSGNLNIPVAVKLWQNPQSADSITILCLGTDGESTAYYMAPAEISSQSESVTVMGFEETTATPGTVSPFGVETFNNALYHPLEDQLMKSTASNYNINHASQSEDIRNMWEDLVTKELLTSSQHDNRLYYLVHNPYGAALEKGCRGNEIWVYDAAAKTGTWSRWLVQAASLHRLEHGSHVFMGVTRPDGIYYFDPEYGFDDYVDGTTVASRAIPWYFETNTMGANRAHDAWCHLQQVGIMLGSFAGHMRFGIKSIDVNGRNVQLEKQVHDEGLLLDELPYDIDEPMLVRRDLREWFFYAGSCVDDTDTVRPSYGQVNLVQFRYTPVTVNVGYEFGSLETFEYGRDRADAASSTSVNGVPLPLLDSRRP